MDALRTLDAMCSTCGEVRIHEATPADPGSCMCTVCGTVQVLMVPLS